MLQCNKIIKKLSCTKRAKFKNKIRFKMKKNNKKSSSNNNKYMLNKWMNKKSSKKKMRNSVEQMFFTIWIHKSWRKFQHRLKMMMLMMKLMQTKLLMQHLMKTKAVKKITLLMENNSLLHNKKMNTMKMKLKMMDQENCFKSYQMKTLM